MSEGRSTYVRADAEWYCEPSWVTELLLDAVAFDGGAHDPACGVGTIPKVLESRGLPASGADVCDRADGKFPTRDFLNPEPRPVSYPNIISNPPTSQLVAFVERGLDVVAPYGLVAVLGPLKWAASQGRYGLFSRSEMEQVLVLSRRPSIPPGEFLAEHGESARKGGSIDFAWYLWRVGKTEPGVALKWLK